MKASHNQPTQPTQSAELSALAEPTASKFVRKARPTMIWVMESVGDRTRLVARWTTQD